MTTNDDLRTLGTLTPAPDTGSTTLPTRTWESPDGTTQWTDNPDGTITMSPTVGEPLTFLLHSRRDNPTPGVCAGTVYYPPGSVPIPATLDGDTFSFPVTVDAVHPGFPADGDPVLVDGIARAVCRGAVNGEPRLSWVDMHRSSLVVPDRLRVPTRRLTPNGFTA